MQTIVRISIVVLALAAPQPAAAGNDRLASAGAFALRIVRLIGANDYADAWTYLHPLHQQAAPRDRYVECENQTPIPGAITRIKIVRAWDASVHVAGLGTPVAGTKVMLRLVITDASIPAQVTVTKTVGLTQVSRRWVWMLPADRYAAYVAGECPR
jgi:hypothetical protein